ncbi:hypothetical protein [Alicyclobacillus sp. ALC3]|uniref:hypothetical protein n=1 Tax=Alicyclobacillus sp. ALC3 TaxID=2796143 RepID=UPI003FCD6E90
MSQEAQSRHAVHIHLCQVTTMGAYRGGTISDIQTNAREFYRGGHCDAADGHSDGISTVECAAKSLRPCARANGDTSFSNAAPTSGHADAATAWT